MNQVIDDAFSIKRFQELESVLAATQEVALNVTGVRSASEGSSRLVDELLQATDRPTRQASALDESVKNFLTHLDG